jgi:hypothetical protein
MFDAALQARFAQSCTDAAFGYARAATAAYAAAFAQTAELWGAPRGMSRRSEETESGDSISFKLPYPWGRAPNPFAQPFMMGPAAAWWGMFPLRGTPACWPAAFALMTAGVPSSVAWPAAEANEAALDAAEIATQSINTVFASYRSESGYAMAQIVSPRRLMAALMLAPFGLSALPAPFTFPGA